MLGLSFGKVIVLVAIIAAVWFGFRWIERLQSAARDRSEQKNVRDRSGDRRVVDLERNPKTGAYEPRRRDD